MMSFRSGIALGALLAASAAQSAVVYTFSSSTAALVYRSPGFIQFGSSGGVQLPNTAFKRGFYYEAAVFLTFTKPPIGPVDLRDVVRLVSYGGVAPIDDRWAFPDGSFGTLGSHTVGGVSFAGLDAGPATLTVTAVPEASNWAMMVAGFGLVGLIVRRRSSPTTVLTGLA